MNAAADSAKDKIWIILKAIFTDTLTQELTAIASRQVESSSAKKADYAEKLDTAAEKDIFKYFLLINVSALEGYLAQSRLQAQSTFGMCKRVAYAGFGIVVIAVILAIISSWKNFNNGLTIAQLTGLAGVVTQLISAIFFFLYNRTLQQFNTSQDKLVSAQEMAISLMAVGAITDVVKRDDVSVEVVKLLLARGAKIGGAAANT
ncbi:TRADD-N-associated membrane domain-containing protein [Burkholderia ubonensis]|uniref:TRADD-N-associated membrane domain-containing protein n=1 Tax=Burkholderia ubonensis TaxID=101571 RepID=UPI002ABDBAF1|nr:hypothetical protein [Burkholderia ubonensis]